MCDNSECTWLSQFFRALVLLFTPWMPCSGYLEKSCWKELSRSFAWELFFCDQCAVDEYVAAHKAHGKAIPKVMLNEDVLDEHFRIV